LSIKQGDIYIVDFGEPIGSEPGYEHPVVVAQNNLFNGSKIRTVAVCLLTTNLGRQYARGNVLLFPGEGDLSEQSVVNISQIVTVDKQVLTHRIGSLRPERVREIVVGLKLLFEPRDISE
jgi:mRNA interferase MazF